MKTLLQKAKDIGDKGPHGKVNFSSEEVELCAAYLRGEVDLYQVRHVMARAKGGELVYSYVCRALRLAFKDGRLKKLE